MLRLSRRGATIALRLLIATAAIGVPSFVCASSHPAVAEPQGFYVLQSAATNALVADTLLRNPHLEGVVLRRYWSDLNPAPGQYDWSYFDREIDRAKQRGKKVQLLVFSGVASPAWVYSAGARPLQFQDERKGTGTFTMPVPWDPVMLDNYETFVRAMGTRYNSEPAVTLVHAGGPTRFSLEFHMPPEVTALPDWSPTALIDAWKRSIRCFDTAFPGKNIALNVSQATSNVDGVAAAVAADAVAVLGPRATLQHDALSAKTSAAFEIHTLIATHATRGTRVGFEMLSASFEPRFGGNFVTAVDIGSRAGAQYLNVYSPDVPGMSEPYQPESILRIYGDHDSPQQPDVIRIARNGNRIEVFINNTSAVPNVTQELDRIIQVSVNGGGGNDILTLDLSNGEPLPEAGLTYDGGVGHDSLELVGNSSGRMLKSPLHLLDETTFVINQPVSLAGPLNNLQGRPLIKTGAGQLTIAGPQNHGIGAGLTVNQGELVLQSDGGINLSVHVNARATFAITQHLTAVHLGSGARATLPEGAGLVLVTGTLAVAPSGAFDMTDNAVVIRGTAATRQGVHASTTALLQRGANSLKWDGSGLMSSTAANDPQARHALGVMVNDDGQGNPFHAAVAGEAIDQNVTLVRYCRYGDANLDGQIDGTDIALMDNGFNAGVASWFTGDFNYDGAVDGTDYALLDNALNQAPIAKPQ